MSDIKVTLVRADVREEQTDDADPRGGHQGLGALRRRHLRHRGPGRGQLSRTSPAELADGDSVEPVAIDSKDGATSCATRPPT